MNKEICLCGHPNDRHENKPIRLPEEYRICEGETIYHIRFLSCMHCSCKEFYPNESKPAYLMKSKYAVETVEELPKEK